MKLKKISIFLCFFHVSFILSSVINWEQQQVEKYTPSNAIIAWDFHGVLVQRQLWRMIKKFYSIIRSDQHPWQMIKIIPNALYDAYDIYYTHTACSTYEEIIEMLSHKYPALDAHKADLLKVTTYYIPLKKSVELLQTLKQAGYRNFLASNMGEHTYQIMAKRYPEIFSNVEGIFLPQPINKNAELKIGKPCIDYFKEFRAFLEHYKIPMTTTIIFIDNSQKNVTAASEAKLGIKAILFTNPDELKRHFDTILTFAK